MVSSNYCLQRTQGMAHISYNDYIFKKLVYEFERL